MQISHTALLLTECGNKINAHHLENRKTWCIHTVEKYLVTKSNKISLRKWTSETIMFVKYDRKNVQILDHCIYRLYTWQEVELGWGVNGSSLSTTLGVPCVFHQLAWVDLFLSFNCQHSFSLVSSFYSFDFLPIHIRKVL